MTTSDIVLNGWATNPLGKAARIAIAAGGMTIATLVLLMATMLTNGAWLFVIAGSALAATSVMAARAPSTVRLAIVAGNLIVIPLIAQLI